MRIVFTIFFTLITALCIKTQAQNKISREKITLIKDSIISTNNDSLKIVLLKEWADIAFITNFGEDLWLQNEIITICEINLEKDISDFSKQWYKEQLWVALDHTGSIYFYEFKNSIEALKYYVPSADILEELGHLNSSSITYGIIGNIYQDLGQYKNANIYFKKRIKVDDKINKKLSVRQKSDSLQLAVEKQNVKAQEILTQKANKLKEETEKVLYMFEVGVAVAIVFLISVGLKTLEYFSI